MKVAWSFETSGAIHPTTRCHATVDPDRQEDRCENLTDIQLQPWLVSLLTNLKFVQNLIRPYSIKYISHGSRERGRRVLQELSKNVILLLLLLFKRPMKIEQISVPKRRHKKFRGLGITQNKRMQHSQHGQISEWRIILCFAWLQVLGRCKNEIFAVLWRHAE